MEKEWRNLLNFIRFIALRFDHDRCFQIAASLTFTTLLSLAPLITIALTMFAAFPVFDHFSYQIKEYLLNNLMPNASGRIITQYMEQFADNAMRLTALGIVFLAATAMTTMLTIDHAFNTIWRVSRPRPLLKRLLVYWAVITLAPLLIGASLSLTSWLVGLSMGYVKHIPVFGVGVLGVLPVLFTTLAFAVLFRLMPNRHMPSSHALIGAVAAAIIYESMNRVFGYYISNFTTYSLVYGAFASVPVFLMWIYLSWLTTLLGAVIAASVSHWHDTEAQKLAPATRLLNALRILQFLENGLQQGISSTFQDMSRSLHLGYDTLEKIIDKLDKANMVIKTKANGWMLVRDANHIRATELLRLFILDRNTLRMVNDDDPLLQWINTCADQLEQNADMTLQELFARC